MCLVGNTTVQFISNGDELWLRATLWRCQCYGAKDGRTKWQCGLLNSWLQDYSEIPVYHLLIRRQRHRSRVHCLIPNYIRWWIAYWIFTFITYKTWKHHIEYLDLWEILHILYFLNLTLEGPIFVCYLVDRLLCRYIVAVCSWVEFQCQSTGMCIRSCLQCNGVCDCADCSDEYNCCELL